MPKLGTFGSMRGVSGDRYSYRDYLVADGDNALPTLVQLRIGRQIRMHTEVLCSSHISPVTHPADVVRLIKRTAPGGAITQSGEQS